MEMNEKNGIRSVGIIGLGALGTLIGARLQEQHADVIIIADPERAQRYRQSGMYCNGQAVPFRYRTPAEAAPVDLLIFATKAGGLNAAMETARGFAGPDTLILSVLNGIASEELLAAAFGPDSILYCTAQGMDAVKAENQVHYVHPGTIVLGEKKPGPVSERVQKTADFLNSHGVTALAVEDAVRRQWGKLMLNVGVNQTVMVYEGTYGTVQAPGQPRDVMLAAMRETQQLAALEGFVIDDREFDQWVALIDSLSPDGMPSMRQDGAAHRKSELELFAGTVIRRAKKYGLAVPVNRRLYETVCKMEAGYEGGR